MVSKPPKLSEIVATLKNPKLEDLQDEMKAIRIQLSSFVEETGKRFESMKTNENNFQTQLSEVRETNGSWNFAKRAEPVHHHLLQLLRAHTPFWSVHR